MKSANFNKMKLKYFVKSELIGRKVKVGKHEGKIIDETKNMLIIETKKGIKKIPKKGKIFEFKYKGKKIKIEGNFLIGRPEERIKKKISIKDRWMKKWLRKKEQEILE